MNQVYQSPQKKLGSKVFITVRDNCSGISQKVIDKIFHPFFTSKPAGQRTGLGLSLSHDKVKARQDGINVKTNEEEFTDFTFTLNQ